METFDDFRTKTLKDRMAGRWFVTNRTRMKVIIETLGRSMAMTFRVLLRKDIGVETFSFWMVLWGICWIRLCMSINAATDETVGFLDNFTNPAAFSNFGTAFLNLFSYFFLIAVIWYNINTEFPTKDTPPPNVLDRGQSVVLKPLIDEEKSFLRKEGFVQAAIAPALGLLLGLLFIRFEQTYGVGLYFTISSIALLIDEVNYHRAVIRYRRIIHGYGDKARKQHQKNRYGTYNQNYDE